MRGAMGLSKEFSQKKEIRSLVAHTVLVVVGMLLANQDTELTKSKWVESERALLRLFKHRERNERKGGTRKALD